MTNSVNSFIISSSLNSDAENLIVGRYLSPCEQITYSGVNKAARQALSNEYFKKLFEERYPHHKNQFQFLSERYPDNCWKVALYVFETGNLKFNQSFLREGCSAVIKILDKRIDESNAKRIKICGDFPYDPASPIHRAWVEHAKTNNSLALDEIAFVDKFVNERKDNLQEVAFHLINEGNSRVFFPDGQLPRWINLLEYQILESSREQIVLSITDAINTQMKFTRDTNELKTSLESFFSEILFDEMDMCAFAEKPNPITHEDWCHFLAVFNGWAQANHFDLETAIKTFRSKTICHGDLTSGDISHTIPNLEKIRGKLNNLLFNHVIQCCVPELHEDCSNGKFEKNIRKIHSQFPHVYPLLIKLGLLNAIHKSNILKDRTSFTSTAKLVYQEILSSIANGSFILSRSVEAVAKNIHDACGIPLETVLEDIEKAIKNSQETKD